MRLDFSGRSIVCLTAMSANALDLEAFERETGLERASTQVVNPQLTLAEYGRLRLLATPDGRVELGAPPNASRDLVRRAARELLRQVSGYALRGVGFNGVTRVEIDEDEPDPIRALLHTALIVERLNTDVTRCGLKLVYPLEDARMTLDIVPDEDDLRASAVSLNRHYSAMPVDTALDEAISWFAALNDELSRLVRRLLAPVVGDQNAA